MVGSPGALHTGPRPRGSLGRWAQGHPNLLSTGRGRRRLGQHPGASRDPHKQMINRRRAVPSGVLGLSSHPERPLSVLSGPGRTWGSRCSPTSGASPRPRPRGNRDHGPSSCPSSVVVTRRGFGCSRWQTRPRRGRPQHRGRPAARWPHGPGTRGGGCAEVAGARGGTAAGPQASTQAAWKQLGRCPHAPPPPPRAAAGALGARLGGRATRQVARHGRPSAGLALVQLGGRLRPAGLAAVARHRRAHSKPLPWARLEVTGAKFGRKKFQSRALASAALGSSRLVSRMHPPRRRQPVPHPGPGAHPGGRDPARIGGASPPQPARGLAHASIVLSL